MLKYLCSAVLSVTGLVCAGDACLAAGPVQKSPVQAPPAPATARADGYRTYSYEPGSVYGANGRSGGLRRPSFLDARSKALGR